MLFFCTLPFKCCEFILPFSEDRVGNIFILFWWREEKGVVGFLGDSDRKNMTKNNLKNLLIDLEFLCRHCDMRMYATGDVGIEATCRS